MAIGHRVDVHQGGHEFVPDDEARFRQSANDLAEDAVLRRSPRWLGQPTISRLAMEASIVLRPTDASRKATVTSSSERVSLDVTTIPSPKRECLTRSPSRNWRSPG